MKKNRFYILVFLLYLIFEVFFHDVIDSLFVKLKYVDLFCEAQTSPVKDVAFLAFTIFWIYTNFTFRIGNEKLLFALTLISTHYMFCRIFSHFYFYPTALSHKIAYLDLIIVSLLVTYVFLLLKIFEKKDEGESEEKADQEVNIHLPLTKTEDDKFDRGYFVKNFIKAYKNSPKAVYGIEGAWGSGKTTVLNFISDLLKDEAIIIDFNPWFCLNKNQIIPEFFNILKSKLHELDPHKAAKLQAEFKKYVSLLTADYSKPINHFFFSEDSRKNEFDEINDLLKDLKLKKTIFVLIDDIDRLEDDCVIECLKLVKLVAHFDSLNFIVTYDKAHILSALGEYRFDSKYIDKVFPQEIQLPEISSNRLSEYLIGLIKNNLPDGDIKILEKHYVNFLEVLNIQFETVREALRVYSSFITSYSFLKDKVLVDELLLIEILRSKNIYFDVFKDLFHMRGNIVSFETTKGTSNLLNLKNDYDSVLESKFGIKDNGKKQLTMLLLYLFSDFRNRSNQPYMSFTTTSDRYDNEIRYDWDVRSIRHKYSSHIYFTLGLDKLRIEPKEIIDFLKSDLTFDEVKNRLQKYINKEKISDFIGLIRNESLLDIGDSYKNLIYVIFLMAEATKIASEQEFLVKVLLDRLPEYILDNERYKQSRHIFICLKEIAEKFEKAQACNVFLLRLIHDGAVYVRKQTYFKTSHEIKEKVDKLFTQYLKSSDLIGGDYFLHMVNLVRRIYQDLINKQDFSISNYLKEIFFSDKESFRSFLTISVYNGHTVEAKSIWSRWYDRFPDLAEQYILPIFRGRDDFRGFIKSIEPWQDEQFVKAYLEFFDKLATEDKLVEFDVNVLNS